MNILDKIADTIKQVITSSDAFVASIGLFILAAQILVGVFKQNWLMLFTGSEYLGKKRGLISTGIFGFILFLSPFVFVYFNIQSYYFQFVIGISVICTMYGSIYWAKKGAKV